MWTAVMGRTFAMQRGTSLAFHGQFSTTHAQSHVVVYVRWSDASSCLPPSSVVWRLSCSREPTTFLSTFLTLNGRPGLCMTVRLRPNSGGAGSAYGLQAIHPLCLWRTAPLQLQLLLVVLYKCYVFTFTYLLTILWLVVGTRCWKSWHSRTSGVSLYVTAPLTPAAMLSPSALTSTTSPFPQLTRASRTTSSPGLKGAPSS